jgi:hypothetical protein
MRSYRAKRLNIAFHKIASARGPPVPQIKSDQVIHNANLVGDDTARFHAKCVRQMIININSKSEKKKKRKRKHGKKTANAIKKQMRFQSESKWPFHDWHTQIIF